MGKGHRTCEVCGVKERHSGKEPLLFSKFPLDPKRCREWLIAVGNEELVYMPIEKLHDQRNVCQNHFVREDFNEKGNRLNRLAVPTLNLMAAPLTDTQLAEFPQHVWRDTNELNPKPSLDPEPSHTDDPDDPDPDDPDPIEEVESPKPLTLCRCCLKENSEMNDDFMELMQCFNMEINPEPNFPNLCCEECYNFLQRARDFRNKALESQSFLLDLIKERETEKECQLELISKSAREKKRRFDVITESATEKHGRLDSKPPDEDDVPNAKRKRLVSNHLRDHSYSISIANSDEGIKDTFDDFQDADQQQTENFTEQSDFEIEVEEFKIKSRQELAVEARAAKLERKAKELEQKAKILENLSTIVKNSTIVPFAKRTNLSNRYDCIYCEENFTSIEILRNHIDTHNDEEQKHEALKSVQDLILRADVSCIRCKICQLRLNTLDKLVQHLTELHNIMYQEIPSTPPHNILPFDLNAEVLKCLVCDKVFKKYKILLRHMNLHYGTHLCPKCGEKFIYLTHYRGHIHFEQHVKPKRASRYFSLNEDHACPVCFRHFKLKCNMLVHLKKGHPKKNHNNKKTQCGICLKTLFCRNLPRHVRIMHPENNGNASPKLLPSATKNGRQKCSICLKKFVSARGLQKHINEKHHEKETELCQENKPSIEGTSDANLVGIPINALNMMELPINDKNVIIIPYDDTNAMEISFDTAAEIEIESIESAT